MRVPRIPHRPADLAGVAVFSLHAAVIALSLACPVLLLRATFLEEGAVDLSPWREAFADLDRWGKLLSTSGAALLTALLVGLPPGILLGALLFRTDVPLRIPVIGLLFLAAAVPLYVTTAAIIAVYGVERLTGSAVALGIIHGTAHLPLVAILTGIAFRTVDRRIEECALVDGAHPAGVLVRLTARLALAGPAAAALLIALWLFTDYSASDILVVRTFAEEIYTRFALEADTRRAIVAGLPPFLLFAPLVFLIVRAHTRHDWRASDRPLLFGTGRAGGALSAGSLALATFLASAPALFLVSRLEGSKGFVHYLRVFAPELRTSLITSGIAGLVCGVLAAGIAWYLVRRRLRLVLTAYLAVLLALPPPLLGIALIGIFNREGLAGEAYDSPLMLVLAYTLRFLPIAVIILVPWAGAVTREEEDCARVDGCGGLGVWWRIVLPRSLPGIAAAAFVVAVLALGELPCSHLVKPPGYFTVGPTFFSKIHYGLEGEAAALALLAVGCVTLPCLGLLGVRAFTRQRNRIS